MTYKEFIKKVEKFNEFSKLWTLNYEVSYCNPKISFYSVNLYFISYDDKFIPQSLLNDFISDECCFGVIYGSKKLTLKFTFNA